MREYLDKHTFMQQYVLPRTSHKKSIEDLLTEAEKAWNAIDSWGLAQPDKTT